MDPGISRAILEALAFARSDHLRTAASCPLRMTNPVPAKGHMVLQSIDRRSVAALLLALATTGCEGRPIEAAGDPGALADTLTAILADAYDFDRPGAAERMAALYADDEMVVSASEGHLIVSADSVRAGIAGFWEEAGQNMRDARWIWREVHVDRLGADAAVLTGSWSLPHIAPAGNEHIIEGAWTAVFSRRGGEWRIVHEHLSSPPH